MHRDRRNVLELGKAGPAQMVELALALGKGVPFGSSRFRAQALVQKQGEIQKIVRRLLERMWPQIDELARWEALYKNVSSGFFMPDFQSLVPLVLKPPPSFRKFVVVVGGWGWNTVAEYCAGFFPVEISQDASEHLWGAYHEKTTRDSSDDIYLAWVGPENGLWALSQGLVTDEHCITFREYLLLALMRFLATGEYTQSSTVCPVPSKDGRRSYVAARWYGSACCVDILPNIGQKELPNLVTMRVELS